MELAEFGTGYPLYFEFVLFCIIMLSIMLTFLGVYAMISSYMADDCTNILANCSVSFINSISIPNKILNNEYYYIQTWVNLVTIIILMISLNCFRRMQKLTENECDRGLVSPSDYSIWLKRLPKGQYTESDIQLFIDQNFPVYDTPINVRRIILAYDISDFMKNCGLVNKLEGKIIKGREEEAKKGSWPEGQSLEELEAEKKELDIVIKEFIRKTENRKGNLIDQTSGDVFVIFSQQKSKTSFVINICCFFKKIVF